MTSSGECEVNRVNRVGGDYLRTEGNPYAIEDTSNKVARHSDVEFYSRLDCW